MADRIEIKDLQVSARVGVPNLERRVPQHLEIDVSLSGDFHELNGDLSRTTDYTAVSEWVHQECAGHEFRLIESLADHLAGGILKSFPNVAEVAIGLRKFVIPGTRYVAVDVTRRRQ